MYLFSNTPPSTNIRLVGALAAFAATSLFTLAVASSVSFA